MTPEPNLKAHLVGDATAEQMAEQWRHIEARLERRPRRRWVWPSLAFAGATAGLVLLAWTLRPLPAPRAWQSQDENLEVALADGSRVEVRPRSHLGLVGERPGETRLRLLRGSARFQARHDPARRFSVTAADVEVLVTGTVFSVALEEGKRARVSVEQGEVEVRPAGQARLLASLRAGESWPPESFARPEPALSPPGGGVPAVAAGEQPATRSSATPASLGPRRPMPSDPRVLLEEANLARRNGDVERAAVLLESLSMRHPRDPRAALATFELGRLRLDALADPAGAVAALKHSIALAPAGVFREDAEACLATAYARVGDRRRCEQARQTYLGHYPEGVHAAAMAALACGAR